jgi:flagellar protein FlbD
MIQLTKLNGATVFVNPDLIRSMELAPDTLLAFIDGERLMVLETPEQVRARILEFRRDCVRRIDEGTPAWT